VQRAKKNPRLKEEKLRGFSIRRLHLTDATRETLKTDERFLGVSVFLAAEKYIRLEYDLNQYLLMFFFAFFCFFLLFSRNPSLFIIIP
jgi:hypothetical protein